MNGNAFVNVPRLVVVILRSNICVDKVFNIENQILFRRRISRNCAPAGVARKEISCTEDRGRSESVPKSFFEHFNRTTTDNCVLDLGTTIDSPDYSFFADANYTVIEILYIVYQQNIEFLPVMVHQTFPILKFYYVMDTPVQKLSKENFEKMFKLLSLYLKNNQIEVIRRNTFEDLVSLKYLTIGSIHDCFDRF